MEITEFIKHSNEVKEKSLIQNKKSVVMNFNLDEKSNSESYSNHLCNHSKKCKICTATKNYFKVKETNFLLETHHKVKKSRKFNYEGCKIPVNTRLNMQYLR